MENKSIEIIKDIWKSLEESKGEYVPRGYTKKFILLFDTLDYDCEILGYVPDKDILYDVRRNWIQATDKWLDVAYRLINMRSVELLNKGKSFIAVPKFHFADIMRAGCPDVFEVQPDMINAIYVDIPGYTQYNFDKSKTEACVDYAPTYFRKRLLKVN